MRTSLICMTLAAASAATAQDLYLTTASNRLVHVHAGRPGLPLQDIPISGLAMNETLRGIDFRPKNGVLYGLGSTSRVYTINLATGAATPMGASSFVPVLNGSSFGFDFNPTVDKIRVTSDADQNLRLDPDTGAVFATDLTLGYGPNDPYRAANPNIVASGYTNSLATATTTTLYDIDSNLDLLVTQLPPNNGQLNTVGKLGIDVTSVTGFDIAYGTNLALMAATTQGGVAGSALFSVNLTTGAATYVGVLGVHEAVTGMAILPTPGADIYGFASPGCFGGPAIAVNSSPTLGNSTFALLNINGLPNTMGRLIFGAKGLQTPVTLWDLNLFVDPSAGVLWIPALTDADGAATVPIAIPNDPFFQNQQAFAQFAWLDRCTLLGASASNAVALTIR